MIVEFKTKTKWCWRCFWFKRHVLQNGRWCCLKCYNASLADIQAQMDAVTDAAHQAFQGMTVNPYWFHLDGETTRQTILRFMADGERRHVKAICHWCYPCNPSSVRHLLPKMVKAGELTRSKKPPYSYQAAKAYRRRPYGPVERFFEALEDNNG